MRSQRAPDELLGCQNGVRRGPGELPRSTRGASNIVSAIVIAIATASAIAIAFAVAIGLAIAIVAVIANVTVKVVY